jgi:hypothetical protein
VSERLVFVPLFGDGGAGVNGQNWDQLEHVKAWGLLTDTEFPDGNFILLHSEPATGHIKPLDRLVAFDEEVKAMQPIDVDAPETTVPDEVWARLAEYRLLGGNSDEA